MKGAHPAELWQSAVNAYQRGNARQAQHAVAPLLEHPAADGNTFLLAALAEVQLANNERAAKLLLEAVKRSPDHVDAWIALGNVCHALGRMTDALSAYRTAADKAPDNAELWNNLGVVNEDMGQVRDALDHYDRALEIDPEFERAHRGRAAMLAQLRWFDEARRAYEELLERYPDDVELKVDFAQFLELANRPDEAADWLPDSNATRDKWLDARIEYLRAQLRMRRGEMEKALSDLQTARRRTGKEFLSYREGMILDRMGRHDEAMEAFTRANQARAGQRNYKRLLSQSLTQYLDAKIAHGIQPADDSIADDDEAGRGLVFITGLPRSGTTLLDRMLAAHPGVQVLEELEGLYAADNALSDGATPAQARRVYWDFIQRHTNLDPEASLVDKNPMHAMHLDVLPRLFPAARTVLVLRHPYDAALSSFMQDFDPGPVTVRFLELASTAAVCKQFLTIMGQYEAARPGHVTRLHYETLVTDFRSEIRRILDFMDLEWHENIEQYARIAAESGPIMTASYEQVTRALYGSSVERWRNYEKWLEPFHQSLGPMLEDFGYSR